MKHLSLRCCAIMLGTLALVSARSVAQQPPKEVPKDTLPPVKVEAPALTPPAEPPEPQVPESIRNFTAPTPNFVPNAPGTLFGPPTTTQNSSRSTTIRSAEQIDQRMSGTTPRLFDSIPGVYMQRTNSAGGSIFIRGRTGNANLILVDGVPINDAGWRLGNVQYLNTVDVGVIDRLEVIRGPGSVLYGNGATGGIINIITKSRKDFSSHFDIDPGFITNYGSASHTAYNRVEIEGNVSSFGFFLGGDYLDVGALSAGDDFLFIEPIVGYEQTAADARIDYLLGPHWRLTFLYQHLNVPKAPRTDRFPFAVVDPLRFTNRPTWANQQHDLTYLRLEGWDDNAAWINGLQLTGWYQRRLELTEEFRFQERALNPNLVPPFPLRNRQIRFRQDSEEINYAGLDFRMFSNLTDSNTLMTGLSYQLDTTDSLRFERLDGTFPNFAPLGLPLRRNPPLPHDGLYSQLGAFFMDYWEPASWLALHGGFRYSDIIAKGTFNPIAPTPLNPTVEFDEHYPVWVGEFGAVVRVTQNLNWFSNIAEGFRAPNLDDLATDDRASSTGAELGGLRLQPEKVTSYETGFKYNSPRLAGSIAYYYAHYDKTIVRDPLPIPDAPPNVFSATNVRVNSDALIHGIELEAFVLLTDNWSVFLAGSQTYGQDIGLGTPFRGINPAYLTVGSRWTYRTPRWGFFLEGWTELMTEQDRLSEDDMNDIRIPLGGTPAWQTVNLRAGFDGIRFGQLTVGLYNIFDQHYRIHGSGVDAPGIELLVGYQLKY
jgi:outer membrane receptor protein involved in Fe transport